MLTIKIKEEWIENLKLNSKRIALAEDKKEVDRVPIYLTFGGYWTANFAGYDNDVYFMNKRAQLDSQLKLSKRFYGAGKDAGYGLTGIFLDPGVITEASALGGEVYYEKESVPWVKPILNDYDDIKKLKKIDFNTGILKSLIDQYKWLKSKGYKPGFYPGIGPLDTAALLRGANNLLTDMYTNEKWVKELVDICADTMISIFRKEEKLNGGKLPGNRVLIGDDYPGMIGPENFKKFVYPYLKKIYESMESSYKRWFHSDADQAEYLVEYLIELGVNVFFAMSSKVNLRRIRKKFGKNICLCGNVSTMNLLNGTPESVEEECLNLMKDLDARKGAFILCPGGEIIKKTPEENIDALIFSTFKY